MLQLLNKLAGKNTEEEVSRLDAPEPTAKEEASQASEQSKHDTIERTEVPPVTIEEMVQSELERLRNVVQAQKSQYQEFVKQIEQMPQTFDTEAEEKTVDFNNLPEDVTVPQLAEMIMREAVRRLRSELRNLLPAINTAEIAVQNVIRQYPYLDVVRDEGIKVLSKLPSSAHTPEVADWVLHALKGRRSEAEKKETLLGLFEAKGHTPVEEVVPYSNEDIKKMADALGIEVNRLKQKLIGGGR